MALTEYLFQGYDVPRVLIPEQPSQPFEKFVLDVFVYAGHDGIVIDGLSSTELAVAKELVRRNLHLRYSHLLTAAPY